MNKTSQPMNKWIPISIIAVLVVALAITATLMGMKISKLNGQINDADTKISGLQSQVNSLQANVSSLQTQLKQAQDIAASLQSSLDKANSQIGTLTSTNSNQAAQIKTMTYPRNFTSIDELTNWLQKANPIPVGVDPSTLTSLQKAQMALALEVKASRDGYILPAILPLLGNLDQMTNRAIVGDFIYEVRAWDNFAQIGGRAVPAMPSYPIPPPGQ